MSIITAGAMTVKELKEVIAEVPDGYHVILSKDSEGNSFSPVPSEQGFSTANYQPETTYFGDITDEGKHNALVLWPTN